MVCYITLENTDESLSLKCLSCGEKDAQIHTGKNCCQQIKLCFIFLGEVCMCVMLEKLFTTPLLVVLFFTKGLFQKPVFKTSRFVFVENVHAFEEPTCVDLFICYAMEQTVNTFHDYLDVFVPHSTTLLSITPY